MKAEYELKELNELPQSPEFSPKIKSPITTGKKPELEEHLSPFQRFTMLATETFDLTTTSAFPSADIAMHVSHVFFPRKFMHVNGLIYRVVAIILFAYFFAATFDQLSRSQKFVSLDIAAGNCDPVAKAWTVTLTADDNGYWLGQSGFTASRAKYVFNLFDFSASSSQYSIFMQNCKLVPSLKRFLLHKFF